jgi:RHS repeat-associated protein
LISSAATVVGTFTYGPTGTLMSSTGTLTSPLGFAGGYTDAETGFEYLVNRYYDPASDQFLSADPAASSTRAPYYYALDNVVNYKDPSGAYTVGMCASGSAALGIGWYHWGAPTGDLCLVRTQFTPSGNDDIGFTDTGGWTMDSVGASVGAGLTYQVSDANALQALGQRFTKVSVSAGAGIGPGAVGDYFWGTSASGLHIHGADLGVSVGVGTSIAMYSTWTDVKQVNNPLLADVLRGIWETLLPPGLGTVQGLLSYVEGSKTAEVDHHSTANCPTKSTLPQDS